MWRILAFFEIEITEHHAPQRADASESRGGEILVNRDLQQAGGGFFGGIENGGNGALRRFTVKTLICVGVNRERGTRNRRKSVAAC